MRLPNYTRNEEIFNMVSHIVGAAIGILIIIFGLLKACVFGDTFYVVSFSIYGVCVFIMFCISSIYHGLLPCKGKKVLRIIDHCDIYFCIAGTYTPILLCGIRLFNSTLAWILFAIEWGVTIIAVILVSINIKKFFKLSIALYIIQGWCIVIAIPVTIQAMTLTGFLLLLSGGIMFTIGAAIYIISKKKNILYGHSVFHLFVIAGIVLQFFSIYLFI